MMLQQNSQPVIVWIAAILTALNIIDRVVGWFQKGQSPVLAKITETNAEMKSMETRITARMEKIERDVGEMVRANKEEVKESLTEFKGNVTAELNGWSKRIDDGAEETERNSRAIEELARADIAFRTEAKAKQENIASQLAKLEGRMDGVVANQTQSEIRMIDQIARSERRILRSIARGVRAVTAAPETSQTTTRSSS